MAKPANSRPSALQVVMKEARRAIRPLVWFSAGINVLMLTGALYMLQVYHRVLGSHSTETLVALTLIAATALATMAALEVVRQRLLAKVGTWMNARLAPVLLTASVEYAAAAPGQVTTRALRDLDQVRNFFTSPSIYPILDAPWAPIFFAAIFLMHPWLGWLALCGGIVLLALAILNEYMTRKPLTEAGSAQVRAYTQADAVIRNAEVVQSMGMLKPLLEIWKVHQDEANDGQSRASSRGGTISAIARSFRQALQMAILGLGAYLVLRNEASGGIMIAASILMGRALAPVEQAISTWKATVGARAAYKRLVAVAGQYQEATPALPLPRPKGRFEADNIGLARQGGGEPILKGINFHLNPGEVMALIGPSAAGKTSLARVLAGAWRPSAGRALLDGMDVAQWASEDRGRHVGYLPQDIELFAGTVSENICRFATLNPTVFNSVIKAAQLAGVHELIKGLPKGYATEIGESGAVLSGGQRQRIGLARALYGDPALLILDEPNSNLDKEGEDALAAAIGIAKATKTTVILIAHRPNIMEKVDKVLVINRGQQDLFGSRDYVFNELAARIRQVSQIPVSHAPEISAAVIGVGNGPSPSSKRPSRQSALSTTEVANQA
ncbi:type I secretion system permease/ATPase [Mesorhizobium sp. M7A.F.Ca.US.006.04.2.1]|uniref:type I secretion system permease/ATPase n=1 Tax=unclassified Mesorhizobium TaxID=325217 RepID=UPI000FCBE813|nr:MULTISPECIES: type I secretion system permease/ATPase [unclassified Mesorhizobium]RUX73272.1 type I secretion system permease/ATPase [Mesorhizobium sp. M7A.F.Ca.US.005.03.1.1]RUY18357.1 type I secretion system permease/ATPase [Mesorhizobium sp. M7A.F.Ca.US.005.03.2.1]RUY30475.1 type I secretion system permease/ATPase [Mesorhizobium sp. M7A.F.Ca.US.001.04.2.1]RUY45332.1 type I secretion system permease/ATPase [Mesorhizobium sp. M7A.F.Ca.US.001.04.1.1]RVA06709.1 type I secretion system permea